MILLSKLLSVGLALLVVGGAAWAQTPAPYPVKPIRAIVPFVAGGGTDLMARSIAQKLSEAFAQQVIVDNRAGGGGVIAAVIVKDAPPDGYTLFFGTISQLATNVAVNKNLPYDPIRDYAPVTLTGSNAYFLITHPAFAANTVPAFIAAARAKPGEVNYASSGAGGGAHLAGALFGAMAKLNLVHVPYKGSAQSVTDLIGGQINSTFAQPPVMLAHAKAGKVKVLGVTSRKRHAAWPDAPPIAEALPGYEAASWQGLVVPARTSAAIIDRLHRETVAALNSNDLRKRLLAEGSEIGGMPPAEFGAYIQSELAKWTKVVRDTGIRVE